MENEHNFIADPGDKNGNETQRNRFPEWAVGWKEWNELRFPEVPPADGSHPLGALLSLTPAQPVPPRVFISHRQKDHPEAMRAAYLANDEGYHFWLDVLDPHLTWLGAHPTSYQKSLAMAAIIEMALLNCSHVLALITQNFPGSAWIPYEYGRVKRANFVTPKAAAWIEPGVNYLTLPEYLFLGPLLPAVPGLLPSEDAIRWWMQHSAGYYLAKPLPWIHGATTPLP